MRRVCYICERYDAKNSIAQSHQVYFYLQRILMLLEMEVYLDNEIIKSKKLCLLRQAKSVEHFLSEGQIYLNMANILHERKRKMSAMSAIMLRAMDIYSKLKIHLRDKEFEDDWRTDEELNSEEEISDDWNHWNIEPFGIELEEELLDFDEFDEPYAADLSKICFYYIGEVPYREFLLANIESLITRIKNLCVVFTGSSSTLYIVLYLTLTDYCEKVNLFLHNNTTITESWQERSLRDVRHKYDLLEQLLARVSKEQEYIAKYVDIKLKKEIGKSNN